MNRYDFIKFGGFVRWTDGTTDAVRKMQVCLPVKEPVGDNTRIGLTASDDGNPEEVCESYSVRAAELTPCPDSFQKGYWKALMSAADNGAGMDVLLPMLGESGLCQAECVFLMLQSNACRLFPVLCRLFPEAEGLLEVIVWEDGEYLARRLTIFRGTPDEQEILVSVTSLQDRLIDSDTGAPVSEAAEAVDNGIYYYLSDDEFTLPEERVVAITESA